MAATSSETAMNTIPDPRSPSPRSAMSRSPSTESIRHPDLSEEVATLSSKLVNALNHQTSLDDTLQSARQELEAARDKIARLEAAAEEHTRLISQGLLVKKINTDKVEEELRDEVAAEKQLRSSAETAKKSIELELENLTSSLFEEANGMVVQARREREASERRNDQLRAQLNDAELLLASHQEQLQSLKAVLEQLQTEQDQGDSNIPSAATPSLPTAGTHESIRKSMEKHNDEVPPPNFVPDQPLHFSHLIQPVLRTDLSVYDDFVSLLNTSKTPLSANRVQSGTFSSLNVMGLGSIGNKDQPSSNSSSSHQQIPSNASNSSLSASAPSSPHIAGTTNGSSTQQDATAFPLRDTKYYRRALTEDIEPTLRLDLAPGLSWLARRTALNAMTTGSLAVEPFPQPARYFYGPGFPCAMCGEARRAPEYARRHRFKTSESEEAQRYPVCDYCVDRVRSTCDYIGFLRMVKNGHWRTETPGEQMAAWEKSVWLRERMFWARIGGGVVPFVPGVPHQKFPASVAIQNASSGSEEVNSSQGSPMASPPKSRPFPVNDDRRAMEEIDEAKIQAETEKQLRDNVEASLAAKSGSPEGGRLSQLASRSLADQSHSEDLRKEDREGAVPGSFSYD